MTQQEALNILKTGRNVFLTGAAGSGKTHVLNEYIAWLRAHEVEPAITASTGIAATHMSGMTIHSWCGIGIKDRFRQHEFEDLTGRSYLRSRIKNARVLIIDEISMLHDYRLDLVDRVIRTIRENPLSPFGGLQVVLSGDFFQLPPIVRRDVPVAQSTVFNVELKGKFVYHSRAWKEMGSTVCYLSEQHRQEDAAYVEILHAIRQGAVSPAMVAMLRTRLHVPTERQASVRLYTHNVDVDAENERELARLAGDPFVSPMVSRGPQALCAALKNGCLASETLRLKAGARVMFVKNNFEQGYVNGTTGVVESVNGSEVFVRTSDGKRIDVERESWVMEDLGRKKAEIMQYPLRLAWAITVHKSQGMSLDQAEIDLSRPFEKGMGYVALSRVRSLKGLSLKGLHDAAFAIHDEALEYDAAFQRESRLNAERLSRMSTTELAAAHRTFLKEISGGKTVKNKRSTVEMTSDLFLSGYGVKDIAQERKLAYGTVVSHLEQLKQEDNTISFARIKNEIPRTRLIMIMRAFAHVGASEGGRRPLKPVYEFLNGKYDYDELRLARLLL